MNDNLKILGGLEPGLKVDIAEKFVQEFSKNTRISRENYTLSLICRVYYVYSEKNVDNRRF